jgi:hypothetical protein
VRTAKVCRFKTSKSLVLGMPPACGTAATGRAHDRIDCHLVEPVDLVERRGYRGIPSEMRNANPGGEERHKSPPCDSL